MKETVGGKEEMEYDGEVWRSVTAAQMFTFYVFFANSDRGHLNTDVHTLWSLE